MANPTRSSGELTEWALSRWVVGAAALLLMMPLLLMLPEAARAQTPGIRVAWDFSTRVRAGARAGDYARVERIGDSDTLALAYGFGVFKLSIDNGETWQDARRSGAGVRDTFPNAHPYNVELEYLDNGDLLLPYNYRAYGRDGVPIQIRVNASSDGGETWNQRAVVAKAADTPGNGIYEPAIIQLPNGDLQLYAATEQPYSGPQAIVMFESTDNGHTWSDGEIISFRGSRDGMPAPLLLNDGKGIAVAIEDNGWPSCPGRFRPTIVRTNSVENSWENAPVRAGPMFVPEFRYQALAPSAALRCNPTQSGPAPYLAQFPQGETLISFHSNIAPFEPRDELGQTTVVAIGNDNARNFTNKSYPYGNQQRPPGPNDGDCGNGVCGSAAIWNSLFVKDSTTATAVTSTAASFESGNERQGTYLIDGYRIPEPRARFAGGDTDVTVDGQLDEDVWEDAHSTFVGAHSPAGGTFHPVWTRDRLVLSCDIEDPNLWADAPIEAQADDACIFDLYFPDDQFSDDGTFRLTAGPEGRLYTEKLTGGSTPEWVDASLDGVEVATSVDDAVGDGGEDEGYTVEIGIPWSSLDVGGRPSLDQAWGINYGIQNDRSGGGELEFQEYVAGNDPERRETWQRIMLKEGTDGGGRINQPASLSLNIDQSFGDASQTEDYRLVAMPGQSEGMRVGDEVEGEAGQEWKAYADTEGAEGDDQLVEYTDEDERFAYAPGRGFWMISTTPRTMSGNVETVPLDGGESFDVPIHEGWNIISNPFGRDVAWEEVKAANGVEQPLWSWNHGVGSFERTSNFESAEQGKAFYYFNDGAESQLTIPYPLTAEVSRLASGAEAHRRALTLSATVGEQPIGGVTVGTSTSPEAKAGADRLDQPAPPARFVKSSLRLVAPETKTKGTSTTWAADFRAAGEEGYAYNLVLKAPQGRAVHLKASSLEAFSKEEVRLVEQATGEVHDLRDASEVRVGASESGTQLRLLVGSADFVERSLEGGSAIPQEATLKAAYPNPLRGGDQATIEYALPSPATVQLELFDVLGQRVKTLASDSQAAGSHEVTWSPDNLSSGVYFYRLTVEGESVTFSDSKRVVIVR